jgi:DNA topoisomerase-6 subunit B
MVHVASVWVPFTSESKEAVANYPEIEKELRLGLQAVGRKLAMYLRCKQQVAQEEERRSIFMRYLKEVANSVADIKGIEPDNLLQRLQKVAVKRTSTADVKLDERGRKVEQSLEKDENVIIVTPESDE